jgi:DNA polymerase V
MFDAPGLVVRPTTSWPSPAQDYGDGPLSLDRVLIRRPAATFAVRVTGDGLTGFGVTDGDVLVVDRSVDPLRGHLVVVVIDAEHRVGRLTSTADGWGLAIDDHVLPLPADAVCWGVATAVIRVLTADRSLTPPRTDS